MKRLTVIISKLMLPSLSGLKWKHSLKILGALLIIFTTIPYCFRENVQQKVESYNTEELNTEEELDYLEVNSVYPETGAANVAVNSDIDVQFNDNVDMLTVDSSTFIVNGGAVTGVYTYDPQTNIVKFNPDSDFTCNTIYSIEITTGIKNEGDETMAGGFSWSFATVPAVQPEIKMNSPLGEIFTGYSYDFGSIVNLTTRSIVFTIMNNGTSNLNITGTALSGVNSGEFIISVSPCSPVIPGGSATFTVDFTPSTVGDKTAALTIISDDADESSFTINFNGVSQPVATPEIKVSKNTENIIGGVTVVDFGSVKVGHDKFITLVMSNTGSGNLDVSNYNITGSNPSSFSTTFAPIPDTIASGTTRTFIVKFSPWYKGHKYADLIFQNSDSDENPFIIKIKGKGK